MLNSPDLITRLAGQALDRAVPETWTTLSLTQLQRFQQAFAELIVAECAEQIKLKGTDWVDWMPSQLGIRPEYVAMAQHIKQHFGVEQ